jgi:hypothetical protein
VHLPPHSLWFWLILECPFLIWLALWALTRYKQVSLKPLTPWLKMGFCLSLPAYIVLDAMDGNQALRLGIGAIFYTCWILQGWIDRRYMFETIGGPTAKWYVPWRSAKFSIPRNARIPVRDIDSVSNWYIDKLGLRKAAEDPWGEPDATTYKFREGGKSMLFANRIKALSAPSLFVVRVMPNEVFGLRRFRWAAHLGGFDDQRGQQHTCFN